jgi:hypothetical protein
MMDLCPICSGNLWQNVCANCRQLVKPPKMGFERQRLVTTGYGKSGYTTVDGVEVHYASGAEKQWLGELDLAIRAGEVREWQWQPEPIPVHYRNSQVECTRTYRPDARVVWVDEGEVFYEIKFGRIETKAGNNIKAFLLTYPERKFCLVWKGPAPKSGKGKQTTKDQWDKIMHIFESDPEKYHVWRLK